MATSGSGAGGKIVTNRRKQRLAATPYDRPPSPPPPKSPNWFTGVIVPSARAIASGAGKILSTIFSESESSSSEDEDYASEDDVDAHNDCETPYSRVNLNETNVTPSEMMQFGQESQLNAWRTETKRIIEQLIMHETFSREECDRLIKILNSRVIDWSVEAGEKSSLAGSPMKMVDHEDDIYNKAIQEAKKWFQEKKVGSSSATQLDHGTINPNLIGVEHVESGGGSPADVARSYMKERPPWASPTSNVEIRTPLTTTMKLFKDGTSYSVARDSLSSSRKRNSLASGSWNIQEELRRVRSKATEDMLRAPTKIDSSLLAAEPTREESVAADKVVPAMGERTTEPNPLSKTKQIDAPLDAGVSPDPSLSALESRKAKVNEAQSSKPATSVSRNNEESGAVQVDGERDASKFPDTSTPSHAGERQSDGRLSDTNGPPAIDATKFGGKQSANGLPKASLSEGHLSDQNNEQHNEENHTSNTSKQEKPASNTVNTEGNCELLTEVYTEVPVVAESNSLASGSQNSLSVQNEELPVEIARPSPKRKADAGAGKQQGRKSARIRVRGSGRGRGRGK